MKAGQGKNLNLCMTIESNKKDVNQHQLLGDHSEREPPDPIPNSEVKPLCADDSVAGCHVKVGHRQALNTKAHLFRWAFKSSLIKS